MFSASFRWESHSSCQHGSGFGSVVEPSGAEVMYVFSDEKGGRGVGARINTAAYI